MDLCCSADDNADHFVEVLEAKIFPEYYKLIEEQDNMKKRQRDKAKSVERKKKKEFRQIARTFRCMIYVFTEEKLHRVVRMNVS